MAGQPRATAQPTRNNPVIPGMPALRYPAQHATWRGAPYELLVVCMTEAGPDAL